MMKEKEQFVNFDGKNKISAFKIDTIQTIKEIFVSDLDYCAMRYSNPILP